MRNLSFVQQLHLGFGGVYIGVQVFRRKLDMQHQQRMLALRQQSAIASLKRLVQRARLHPAPIDKERHMLPVGLGKCAIPDISMQAKCMLSPLLVRERVQHLRQRQVVEFGQRGGKIA